MGSIKLEMLPVIPLEYGTVLFPGKSLNLSPANREDVTALISKYYSGALQAKNKDNAPLVACVPLRSPYLSFDGKKLIQDSRADAPKSEPDVTRASKSDLFHYGCIAKIAGIRGGRRGDVALVVEGQNRCKIDRFMQEKPYMMAQVQEFKDVGTPNSLVLHVWNVLNLMNLYS